METNINIIEIIKDKPQGTKLYSSACGKCKLESVDDKSFKISFYNSKFGFMNGGEGYLDKNGKLYDDGECVVFPSKEMRNWSKFAWKKGDVLVGVGQRIIFEKFIDENYTKFQGKYSLSTYEDRTLVADKKCYTSDFRKLDDNVNVKNYFKEIEEKLGGKLNRETLEVEKTQPEFKDGDIVHDVHGYNTYIIKEFTNKHIKIYAGLSKQYGAISHKIGISEIFHLRLATEEEKQQLFSALAKEGKAWDAEKKQIVDLEPKVDELKPFDKVLVRNDKEDQWSANIFSYQVGDMYYCLGECYWRYCIPYIGNESLLGTTKDVEG